MAAAAAVIAAAADRPERQRRSSTRAATCACPPTIAPRYEFLGTWAVAAKERGSEELHVVYASPGTITAYRKNGAFPTARCS